MPACAQRLEAPSPSRAPETTVTGSGASLSAVNRPARPAPTTTMPLAPLCTLGGNWLCDVILGCAPACMRFRLVVEIDHALHGRARPLGDAWVDRDFLLEEHEAVEDRRKRDALHVRTEIAGPHELHLRRFDRDVIAHRALRDEQHLGRLVVLDPFDHARGGAGVVGLLDHVLVAFGMRDDLDARIRLAIGAELGAREALMHLAMTLPGNDLDRGLRRHVFG